jgi:hypothetical protein
MFVSSEVEITQIKVKINKNLFFPEL